MIGFSFYFVLAYSGVKSLGVSIVTCMHFEFLM